VPTSKEAVLQNLIARSATRNSSEQIAKLNNTNNHIAQEYVLIGTVIQKRQSTQTGKAELPSATRQFEKLLSLV
jgi:phage FluMu protein gp41